MASCLGRSKMLPGVLRHRSAGRPAIAASSVEGARKSAFDVAKWVIPSVGALAALVGFVAESAHQSLLGVELGDRGAAAYIWSTGQFVRTVAGAISSLSFLRQLSYTHLPLELWLLLSTVVVGSVLYGVRRLKGPDVRLPFWARFVFTSMLAAILTWRLLAIEIPLARVENLLVGGARAVEVALDYETATGIEKLVLKRSVAFYSFLRCARQQDAKVPHLRITCERQRDYESESIGLMLITICAGIAMLAVAALLWPHVSDTTAVVFFLPMALYCCLGPAFVYGKLVKTPSFESALIQVKTALEQMPAQTAFSGHSAVANSTGRLMTAIILGHDDKMLSLYVSQSKPCGASESTYEWVPWQVPISEVVAVREIQTLDVISERFKQLPCPDSALPP